jgi:rubrerythrin
VPEHDGARAMKRLVLAPNIALATLWADLLTNAGIEATVQRMYASSIAGELPPDQALPEVWISDDAELERARGLLDALRHPAHRHWACRGCGEIVDGPFDQCWNCGADMPP